MYYMTIAIGRNRSEKNAYTLKTPVVVALHIWPTFIYGLECIIIPITNRKVKKTLCACFSYNQPFPDMSPKNLLITKSGCRSQLLREIICSFI